jgi:hypothetical protein
MKFRAIIKQTDDWWIGWLIDLPGVNAQERIRAQVIPSTLLKYTLPRTACYDMRGWVE